MVLALSFVSITGGRVASLRGGLNSGVLRQSDSICMATPAWTRKEGKSPSGGLNAKGRASYSGNLQAPVKGRPKSPSEMRRKGSFLSRMGNGKGPERKPNGEATRLLLSLQAWGASSKEDAKKKGKFWLDRYHATKDKK